MNKIIFLLVFTLIPLTQFSYAIDKNIHIEKSDVGYDVYSANKELLLKFTKTNSDSSELALIKYIYDNQNEINSEVLDKMVIVKQDKFKDYWDYLQSIGTIITALALIITLWKARKDNRHNKELIKTMQQELDLRKEEHLISLRPFFQVCRNVEPFTQGECQYYRCYIINSSKVAFNFNIVVLSEISKLGFQIDLSCVPMMLKERQEIDFDISVPLNNKNSLFQGHIYFNDCIGRRFKQFVKANKDGNIELDEPELCKDKFEGFILKEKPQPIVKQF